MCYNLLKKSYISFTEVKNLEIIISYISLLTFPVQTFPPHLSPGVLSLDTEPLLWIAVNSTQNENR